MAAFQKEKVHLKAQYELLLMERDKAMAGMQHEEEGWREEKERLSAEVASLLGELQGLQTQHAQVLTERDKSIAGFGQQLTTLQQAKESLEVQRHELEECLTIAEEVIAQQEALGELGRDAYTTKMTVASVVQKTRGLLQEVEIVKEVCQQSVAEERARSAEEQEIMLEEFRQEMAWWQEKIAQHKQEIEDVKYQNRNLAREAHRAALEYKQEKVLGIEQRGLWNDERDRLKALVAKLSQELAQWEECCGERGGDAVRG